jgi:hypothetical protein
VQIVDTSIVHVHKQGPEITANEERGRVAAAAQWPHERASRRSRYQWMAVRLALITGDSRRVLALLAGLKSGSNVACRSADREYDAE